MNQTKAPLSQLLEADADGRVDIGSCRSLRVTCISEIGWRDNQQLLADIEAGGGAEADQWYTPWDADNGAGSASLIEIVLHDGRLFRILLDTGWDPDYMARRFAATGVDELLRQGQIDLLLLSHEHLDHLWGLEAVLSLNAEIPIVLPGSFGAEGEAFLDGAEFAVAGARNRIPHRGPRIQHRGDAVYQLADGVAAVNFDFPNMFGVESEQSLYVNIAGHGIVCITGCCHQTITRFADFARARLRGGDKLYGLYGGLHIAPLGPLSAKGEEMVRNMGSYGFEKIACNHCTGAAAVEKMIELGYPVVGGSAQDGSTSPLYVGNGDQVEFGAQWPGAA